MLLFLDRATSALNTKQDCLAGLQPKHGFLLSGCMKSRRKGERSHCFVSVNMLFSSGVGKTCFKDGI